MRRSKEIRKDVPGYDGRYSASIGGRLRHNTKYGSFVMSPYLCNNGYLTIKLSNLGSRKSITVHKIICLTFLGERDPGMVVNHIDGNKLNNQLSNLEYCTPRENNLHAYRVGLKTPSRPGLGKIGKSFKNHKLIGQYTIDGTYIRSFYGAGEVYRKLGIRNPHNVCVGRSKTAGGYKRKYI